MSSAARTRQTDSVAPLSSLRPSRAAASPSPTSWRCCQRASPTDEERGFPLSLRQGSDHCASQRASQMDVVGGYLRAIRTGEDGGYPRGSPMGEGDGCHPWSLRRGLVCRASPQTGSGRDCANPSRGADPCHRPCRHAGVGHGCRQTSRVDDDRGVHRTSRRPNREAGVGCRHGFRPLVRRLSQTQMQVHPSRRQTCTSPWSCRSWRY